MFRYLVILLVVFLSPVVAFANVDIVYVMCNPVGSDVDGEYIEIKNSGSNSIDLTGWKLNDGSNHNINIPPKNGGKGSIVISPNSNAILANKADKVSVSSATIIDTVMSLSNSGDTVKLIDADGVEVASVTYTKDQVVEGGSCINSSGAPLGLSNGSSVNNSTVTTNENITYRTVEIQPPQEIHIRPLPDVESLLGGTISISPEVYDAIGKTTDASCEVTFGDGSIGRSCNISHVYEYPGEYIVRLSVSSSSLHDSTQFKVKIVEPKLYAIVGENKEYVELHNYAVNDVELNGWSLQIGYRRFDIPDGTLISANSSIKIPQSIMKFNIKRTGGKVELRNVFNKTVAYTKPIEDTVTTVVQSNTATQADKPIVTKTIVTNLVENKSILKSKTAVKPSTRSIIGMPLDNIKQSSAHKDNNANIKDLIKQHTVIIQNNNQRQVASSNTAIRARLSRENSEYIKWLLAVGAIILLGLVPLLIGKDSNVNNNKTNALLEDDSVDFTITEVT